MKERNIPEPVNHGNSPPPKRQTRRRNIRISGGWIAFVVWTVAVIIAAVFVVVYIPDYSHKDYKSQYIQLNIDSGDEIVVRPGESVIRLFAEANEEFTLIVGGEQIEAMKDESVAGNVDVFSAERFIDETYETIAVSVNTESSMEVVVSLESESQIEVSFASSNFTVELLLVVTAFALWLVVIVVIMLAEM